MTRRHWGTAGVVLLLAGLFMWGWTADSLYAFFGVAAGLACGLIGTFPTDGGAE